jgi:DNA polymerase-3 subunit alpha
MEKFAGYGFNKSHSAAYALVAYHTAYLKAHYPVEFMAACSRRRWPTPTR